MNRSVPTYDPRRLLNPRGARQATGSQKSNPYLKAFDSDSESRETMSAARVNPPAPSFQREHSASRSMIEDLYGVQRRAEPPAKRAKIDPDQKSDKAKGKGTTRNHQSSGIVGEYMRPNANELEQTTDHQKIVDLTNGKNKHFNLYTLTD